jgi:endonuclease/exonuclease/phosphatase family metal-dependent hydrolase
MAWRTMAGRLGFTVPVVLSAVLSLGVARSDATIRGTWRMEPATATDPDEIGLMSFNVCGGVCRRGEVTRTADHIAGAVLDHRVSVVLLQELCYRQFVRVRSRLAGHGFRALFAAQRQSRRCGGAGHGGVGHGRDFGVAILVRGRTAKTVVRHLPTTRGAEGRLLLGTTATVAGRSTFVVCVHLSPSPSQGRDRQLAAVADLVGRRADRPAIVGGDFNTIPGDPGLARLYSPSVGGSGRFTELDETRNGNPEMGGAGTFAHRKIDYMFLSEAHFTHQRAEAVPTRYSDHRIYLGRAQPVPDGP